MGDTIGNLSKLQHLDLCRNQISGSIPESIGGLISVTSLNLNNNQISGSIPDTIGNISELCRLYLNNNKISGSLPESLYGREMDAVDISYNYIDEVTFDFPSRNWNTAEYNQRIPNQKSARNIA